MISADLSDYVELVKKLIKVSTENGVRKEIIEKVLDEKTENPGFYPDFKSIKICLKEDFKLMSLLG